MSTNKNSYKFKLKNALLITDKELLYRSLKSNGIEKAELDIENCEIELFTDEWKSEYECITALMEALNGNGGAEIDFSTAEREAETGTVTENEAETEVEDEAEAETENETELEEEHTVENVDKTKKKEKTVEAKANLFKRYLFAGCELAVALICLLVATLFLKDNERAQSFVCVLAFSIGGYEIIWEVFAKIFRKQYLSVELLIMIISIIGLLLGNYLEITGMVIMFRFLFLLEKFVFEKCDDIVFGKQDLSENVYEKVTDEETLDIYGADIKSGDVLELKTGMIIPVLSRILSETAKFTVGEKSEEIEIKNGESICQGAKLTSEICKVECLNNYTETEQYAFVKRAKDSVASEKETENKLNKKNFVIIAAFFAVAAIIAFIPQIFDKDFNFKIYYSESALAAWSYIAISVLAVACCCRLTSAVLMSRRVGATFLEKHNIFLDDYKSIDSLSKVKSIAFTRAALIDGREVKVKKIVSTENYKGKVAEYFINAFSDEENSFVIALKEKAEKTVAKVARIENEQNGFIAEVNGERVIIGEREYLEKNGISIASGKANGYQLYLAVNGCFAGVISFTIKLKENCIGAIKELKAFGIKDISILADEKEYTDRIITSELKVNFIYGNVSENLKQISAATDRLLFVKTQEEMVDTDEKTIVTILAEKYFNGFGGAILDCSSDLSFIPQTVKMSVKCKKTSKWNNVWTIISTCLLAVATIIICRFVGYKCLWLSVLLAVLCFAVSTLNALRNYLKNY